LSQTNTVALADGSKVIVESSRDGFAERLPENGIFAMLEALPVKGPWT